MTDLRFKNVFITKAFHEIDEKRTELKMETALPLTESERKLYVELASLKLVRHEYRLVFEKSVFLLASTLHLCGILLSDYALFWLLSLIQFYGNYSAGIEIEGDKRRRMEMFRSEQTCFRINRRSDRGNYVKVETDSPRTCEWMTG